MNVEALRKAGWVTVNEAAEAIGCSAEWIRRWVRDGKVKAIAPTPRKTLVFMQSVVDRLDPKAARALRLKQTARA